jgi:hypothetical protein
MVHVGVLLVILGIGQQMTLALYSTSFVQTKLFGE